MALARALYGEPRLLVLDEPNAFLDQAGEAALVGALAKARTRGATVIVIAHRRGVLDAADRLLVLEEGRPKMIGPAAEVVARLTGPKDRGECRMSDARRHFRRCPKPRPAIRSREIRLGHDRSRSLSSSCSSAGRRSCRSMPACTPPARSRSPAIARASSTRWRRRHGDPRARRPACPAGEVLVELSAPELKASERALTSDYLTLAGAARAPAGGADRPARLRRRRPNSRRSAPRTGRSPQQVMQLQRSEMHARSGSISAQQSVLGQRAGSSSSSRAAM